MEKTIACRIGFGLPEVVIFAIKSGLFLLLSAAILYLLLGATYPPVHDAVHYFRHALAVVPCH